MRGIVSAAGYVPHHRLRREAAGEVLGSRTRPGTRAVASYDEDTTTMGVEAARLALRAAGGPRPQRLWFTTAEPAYLDKTNATTIHGALRLPDDVAAADLGGAPRSAPAALAAALRPGVPTLVVAADMRTGLPDSDDELAGGDAAAAVLVGDEADGPLLAEHVATASVTSEFIDRWRRPGRVRSRQWEDRFVASRYVPMAERAVGRVCGDAGVEPGGLDRLVVAGLHPRSVRKTTRALDVSGDTVVDDRREAIGNPGTAQAALLLADVLERAEPDELVAVLSLADGADAFLLRTTAALDDWRPVRTVAAQAAGGDDGLAYADFLAWRGMIEREPPRRPDPARVSAPAAARGGDWKLGFVGSRDPDTGAVHLPPAQVSFDGGEVRGDADLPPMEDAPMADVPATVRTWTVDRVAQSPAPPTVFAVLDFDGGGRYACQVTDVDPEELSVGDRVRMTFRLVNQADGLRNYFWKARPVPAAEGARAGTAD